MTDIIWVPKAAEQRRRRFVEAEEAAKVHRKESAPDSSRRPRRLLPGAMPQRAPPGRLEEKVATRVAGPGAELTAVAPIHAQTAETTNASFVDHSTTEDAIVPPDKLLGQGSGRQPDSPIGSGLDLGSLRLSLMTPVSMTL